MGQGIIGHLLDRIQRRCPLYGAEMAMMERYDEEATSEATIICRNDDQDALAGAVAEKSSDETNLKL